MFDPKSPDVHLQDELLCWKIVAYAVFYFIGIWHATVDKSYNWVIVLVSLSALDRRRVVAPSMLTDPSQHSKHQKETALCSWWPAPLSIFADNLVVSSRCQTVLSLVVTWQRCRAWWTGAAWSIRLTWPKRECLLRFIASFMDGSCDRVATSTFVANSYRRCQVFAFSSSYVRPPVSLYQLSIASMFQKHIAVMTGHTNCRCET